MASRTQSQEKIMVFGTDDFINANPVELKKNSKRYIPEPNRDLLYAAWAEYQGKSNYLISELRSSTDEFMKMDLSEWQYLMDPNNSDKEYTEIRFMLACFILVICERRI